MKRISSALVLGNILAICSLFALPSGVFLGGNLGLAFNNQTIKAVDASGISYSEHNLQAPLSLGLDYGIRLGYILALNDRHAFKFSATYDYSKVFDYDFMQAGASIDYLFSLRSEASSGGFFIGGGFEWGFYDFANELKPYIERNYGNRHLPYMQIGVFKPLDSAGKLMMQFGGKYTFQNYIDIDYVSKDGGIKNGSLKDVASNVFTLFFNLNYTF